MGEEVFIPIGLFVLIFGVVWMLGTFAQRKRLAIHETIRLAMEKGQELSPKMIKDMSMITDPRITDLRRGIVLLALAIAFCLIGIINLALHSGDGAEALFSIAVFPGMIGAAFIALWRYGYSQESD